MSTGRFIVMGDKTTCGGVVIEGDPNQTIMGKPTACEGHKVTCGKDGKVYVITGGISSYWVMSPRAAGDLDSYSTCSCHARLIPSSSAITYEHVSSSLGATHSAIEPEQPMQYTQSAKKANHSEFVQTDPEPQAEPQPEPRQAVDAGFCVVEMPSNPKEYGDEKIFRDPPAGTRELYDSLNGSGKFKTGSILLIVDPLKQDPQQIATLQKAKARVDAALAPLSDEEADFLYKYRGAIDTFTAFGSGTSGMLSEVGKAYFEEINKILIKIQTTYKNAYMTRGALIGQQFYAERQVHFKQLDILLNRFIKTKINMPQYESIKRTLGLSSRSIMHQWNQSGVSDIEGYATFIEGSAKLIKGIKTLGYIGIALDFGNTSNTVYDACSVGRKDECTKAAFVGYSRFAGGTGFGVVGGQVVGLGSMSLCMWGLGLITAEVGGAGALLCTAVGVVGGIAGGTKVGEYGGDIGEAIGYKLYEITY
ncbi:MAG: PAAR domain-containing protein [Hafnia alvei]|uniref:PAAR domain-containing protein n=1 Tax=Hafnia alvei TaxID=569 RepID=UPI003F9058F0